MDIFIFLYKIDKKITELQINSINILINPKNIYLVNNSKNFLYSIKIKKICKEYNLNYIKIKNNKQKDNSKNHAFALDYIYKNFCIKSKKKIFFLDQDIIPIKKIEEDKFLDKDIICWNYYEKLKKENPSIQKNLYLWPGLIYFNFKKIKKEIETFMPDFNRDTGWQLKNLISSNSGFFDMKEISDEITNIPFEVMSINKIDFFIHMSKSSNWTKNNTRIYKKRKENFYKKAKELLNIKSSEKDWEIRYNNIKEFNKNDCLNYFIKKYFSNNIEEKTCFEIGCYPGRYLNTFGSLGYKIGGIDYYTGSKNYLEKLFTSKKYKITNFYENNIFDFNNNTKYSIVCSFGFIEHFVNWKNILDIHINLVEENGYLLITAPNFNNFLQKKLRKYLDKKNLEKHELESISIKKWTEYLENNGFKKIYAGYIGNFDFWYEEDQNRILFKKLILIIINKLSWILKPIKGKLFSAHCVIIFKKNK